MRFWDLLFDLLIFWGVDRINRLDKKGHPVIHALIMLLKTAVIISGIVLAGYFIFFLIAFSGYRGG